MEKESNVVLCKPTNTTRFLMENREKVAPIIYRTEKGKRKEERKKEKKTERKTKM